MLVAWGVGGARLVVQRETDRMISSYVGYRASWSFERQTKCLLIIPYSKRNIYHCVLKGKYGGVFLPPVEKGK